MKAKYILEELLLLLIMNSNGCVFSKKSNFATVRLFNTINLFRSSEELTIKDIKKFYNNCKAF